MSNETKEETGFAGWAILELMGHRRLGGMVSEAEIAGAKFLRIDVPGLDAATVATQFYSPGSVYCLTPVTEAMARAAARSCQPEPVTRWELPEPPKKTRAERGLCNGHDEACVCQRGHKGACTDDMSELETCGGCGATTGPGGTKFVPSSDEALCADCAKPDAPPRPPKSAVMCARTAGCIRDAGHVGDCEDMPF